MQLASYCTTCLPGRRVIPCPWVQVAQLTVLFVTFLLLQLFKSRSRSCSPAYFGLFVTQAVLCACATAVFLWRAAKQQKQQVSSSGRG